MDLYINWKCITMSAFKLISFITILSRHKTFCCIAEIYIAHDAK